MLLAVARMNRWATRHADLDVPSAQGRLLSLVQEIGPARIGDLAVADHCSQPTMTTQVQRLEKLGWLTRRADSRDARASLVDITPSGTQVLQEARSARAGVVSPLLENLTEREFEVLDEAVEILERMVKVAKD